MNSKKEAGEIKGIISEGERSVNEHINNVGVQVVVSEDFRKMRRLAESGKANLEELRQYAETLKKAVDEMPPGDHPNAKEALDRLHEIEYTVRKAIKWLMEESSKKE